MQVNPERVGFYRVSYSSELFLALSPALSSHTLSARDRLGLQNDAFAMVKHITHIHTHTCTIHTVHTYVASETDSIVQCGLCGVCNLCISKLNIVSAHVLLCISKLNIL